MASIDHLQILKNEFPILFEDIPPNENWNEDFIILPINNPEEISSNKPNGGNNEVSIFWDDLVENMPPKIANSPFENEPFNKRDQGFTGHFKVNKVYGGAASGAGSGSFALPPDALAVYLPFHFFYPEWWGIYIFHEGLEYLMNQIIQRSHGKVKADLALVAARLFLYYHEAFHHQTECFATRWELTHRIPLYKAGFSELYAKTLGTPFCLEEGLANAYALNNVKKKIKNADVYEALCSYVAAMPPGYNRGVEFTSKYELNRAGFAEKNQQFCFPEKPISIAATWLSSGHLFDGISNIKSKVNYVINRAAPITKRGDFRPLLSPRELVKKLEESCGFEFVRNGGNHDIYQTREGKKIPIPRHQRDLHRGLIAKIIKQANLNIGISEFMQK